MADHDIDNDDKPLKETLFDSISSDREWLKSKNERGTQIIALKEKMLQMMSDHPVIEEWFKLYQEVRKG